MLRLFGEVCGVVPLASFFTFGKVATEAFESTATERARGSNVSWRRQCNGRHARVFSLEFHRSGKARGQIAG